MSIQDWGAVGEILGGIAVFLSLGYLALQIRQSNIQAKAESLRIGTQSWVLQQQKAFDSEEKVAFMRKALNDYTGLSHDERGRLWAILLGYIAPFDNLYNQYEAGLLRKEVFESIEGAFISIVTSPGARECLVAFHASSPLPEYLMAYIRGDVPGANEVQPMSETFEFVKIQDDA